jgi:hypothetical protein
MVESKLVELAVAGSSPVGHPIFKINDLRNMQPKLPQKVTTNTTVFDGIFDV